MYKISIIIPVYNAGQYIEECMASLKKQTIGFENLEVIMADDRSTDNSREKMERYAQQYENVTCIYLSENSGAAGKPRNEAMKLASAEYMMFLDPDDIYFENACEILLNEMEQKQVDLVSGYFTTFDDTDGILEENIFAKRNIEEKIYHMPEDISDIAKFKNAFCCKIYRHEIIKHEKIIFPEKIIGQDSVFMWDYLFHINTVCYKPVPVLGYRLRKENNPSVSFTLTQKHFEDVLESMRLIRELFAAYGLEGQTIYAFGDINVYYIRQMIDSSLSEAVLEELLRQWGWLLMEADQVEEKDAYTNIVMCDVRRNDMKGAAKKILLLREQKCYQQEAEKARDWWRKQAEAKDKEIENYQKIEKELRKWIQELEDARDMRRSRLKKWMIQLCGRRKKD